MACIFLKENFGKDERGKTIKTKTCQHGDHICGKHKTKIIMKNNNEYIACD